MKSNPAADSPVQRLMQWEAGQPAAPWYVSLFPTNRCNLKCSICWQRSVEIDYSDEVSDERLLALVDECADLGVREWVIVGGGEPMVRDELVIQLCERIRSRGMNGRLQTNGTRFKPGHFVKLMDMGWNSVVFSLDGSTAEINDTIRSTGSYEKAVENMRRMVAMRRERGLAHPLLLLSAVITHQNVSRLDEYVELGHSLGCDMLGAGHLTLFGDNTTAFRLTPEDIASLPDYVNRSMARAKELGIETSLDSLLLAPADTEVKSFPPAPSRDSAGILRTACFEPLTSIQILADGKVGPCCVFWDTEAENIRQKPLRDIWFGPYFQRLREKMMAGKFESYCVYCHSSMRGRDMSMRNGLEARRQEEEARRIRHEDEERLKNLNMPQKALYFAAKALRSAQSHGVSAALRRGTEYWRIRAKQRAADRK